MLFKLDAALNSFVRCSLAHIDRSLLKPITYRLLRTVIFPEQITICQVSRLACTMNEITDGRVADSRGRDLDIIKIHALIKTGESREGFMESSKIIQRRVMPSFSRQVGLHLTRG